MRINVGGQQTIGRFPEGWVCVDILDGADIKCDISIERLPIESGVVKAIYCSHVLEHIWSWKLKWVLDEFYRVLSDDGIIRIVVPDMAIAIQNYLDSRGDVGALDRWMCWWFDPSLDKEGNVCLNHVTGFDFWKMYKALEVVGFKQITRRLFGINKEIFDGCDNPGHEKTSLYMEAIK